MAQGESGRVARFLDGLVAPVTGLGYLLRHPSLWKWAALPIAVNVMLFGMVVAGLGAAAMRWVERYHPQSWGGTLLWYPALAVLWIAVLLLGALLINALGTIVAGPFNEVLSGKVETLEGRAPVVAEGFRVAVSRLGRSLINELGKWGLYLFAMTALVPLWLIPVLGQIIWVGVGAILTFWFLGMEFLDHCFGRRDWTFSQRRSFCWRHRWSLWGIGAGVSLTGTVPFLGLVTMPIAVIGATRIFLGLEPAPPAASGVVSTGV